MEEIKFLVNLQKNLTERIELLEAEKGMPEMLDDLSKQVDQFTKKIEKNELLKKEKTAHKKNLELEIMSVKERIEKYRESQNDVESNRDYDLITQQIENEKEKIIKFEADIQNVQNDIELIENRLNGESGIIKKLEELEMAKQSSEEELNEVRQSSKQRLKEIEESITKIRETIKGKASNLLDSFDYISKRLDDPVVYFDRGACNGCSTMIPASSHIKILKGHYHVCESCGRIVVNTPFFELAEEEKEVSDRDD